MIKVKKKIKIKLMIIKTTNQKKKLMKIIMEKKKKIKMKKIMLIIVVFKKLKTKIFKMITKSKIIIMKNILKMKRKKQKKN